MLYKFKISLFIGHKTLTGLKSVLLLIIEQKHAHTKYMKTYEKKQKFPLFRKYLLKNPCQHENIHTFTYEIIHLRMKSYIFSKNQTKVA